MLPSSGSGSFVSMTDASQRSKRLNKLPGILLEKMSKLSRLKNGSFLFLQNLFITSNLARIIVWRTSRQLSLERLIHNNILKINLSVLQIGHMLLF